MKLYGGKHPHSEHEQPASEYTAKIPRPRRRRMTTSTKLMIAIIALIITIAVLVATYFALYISSPSQRPERTTTAQPVSTTTAASAVTSKKPATDSNVVSDQTTAATTEAGPSQEDLEQEVLDMVEEIDVSNADYKEGYFTMAVVGTDEDGIRTDTIIVATFDTENKTVAMLNVPRDTLSKSKSGTSHKINNAYNNGIERTKVELKNLLGFAIDKYVILDFNAFEEIVDAIGGVEIDVPVNMYYNDPDQDLHINIKKGTQVLDGKNALHFMRYRGYANADIDRISAQQAFYKALAKKMATPSTLLKLPALADVVLNNVETDLTLGEIIWLGATYITIDTSEIITETLPHTAKYINGISYVLPSRSGILKVVNSYFNPYTKDITQLNLAEPPEQTTKATAKPTVETIPENSDEPENPSETTDPNAPSTDPNLPIVTPNQPSDPSGGIIVGPVIGGSTDIDEDGNIAASTTAAPSQSEPENPDMQMPEWLRPQ